MSTYAPLRPEELAEIERLFHEVVVPVMTAEHANEDGRSGAVLDLRDCDDQTLIHIEGGTAPEEKFDDYHVNAREKNDALETNADIKTSFEVHMGDVSKKPYPGAIRSLADDRFSISGFTWQRDVVGSLYLAYRTGRIGLGEAANRATICGIRPQFIQLMHKLNNRQRSLAVAA